MNRIIVPSNCLECGLPVRGLGVYISPTIFKIQLGIAKAGLRHKACHAKAEAAEAEIKP